MCDERFPSRESDQQEDANNADLNANVLVLETFMSQQSMKGQTNMTNTMNPMLSTATVAENSFSQRNVA